MYDDGTIETQQTTKMDVKLDASRLEQLYWCEVALATFGLARFSRCAIRLVVGGPALLCFGPLVDGRRAIVGGWFSRRPGGTIRWHTDGVQASVVLEGFLSLLGGPLWRLESAFHDLVGRRLLARVALGVG